MSEIDKHIESRIRRTTALMYDREYWEEWKERFKTSHNPDDPQVITESEKKYEYITRHMHMDSGSLLDIGCATGMLVHYFRRKGWNAHGIDVLPDGRELAPAETRPYLFVGSVTDIKLPRQYDILTAFDVMEHLYIEEIFKAVQEIERVAAKAFLMRCPVDGYHGEGGIPDLAMANNDRGHVGIYTWQFWARRFTENGVFGLDNVEIWDSQSAPGYYMECWLLFKRRQCAP